MRLLTAATNRRAGWI